MYRRLNGSTSADIAGPGRKQLNGENATIPDHDQNWECDQRHSETEERCQKRDAAANEQ